MQHGHLIEKLVGEFNSRFFMNDFVFLNPRYSRGSNQRELCDLLLVLHDQCVVISVKSTDGTAKTPEKFKKWIIKETRKGCDQAKGGISWLCKVSFVGRNLWNEDRTFAADFLKPLCGITLLECSQHPHGSVEYEMAVPESTVPLHVLSVNDFLNVVTCLGSIYDLFDYFTKRAKVARSFTGINQEQPLLSYYTLVAKEFDGYPAYDKEILIAKHNAHMVRNLAQYDGRDRYAAYVNAVVRELHTRHPSIENFMPPEMLMDVPHPDDTSSRLEMASMLNSLPMSVKVYIGRELAQRYNTIKDSGKGSSLAVRPLSQDHVFVFTLFSKISRTERIRKLHPIVIAALCQYQMTSGLGVAFDGDNLETGFDVVLVRNHSAFTHRDRALGEYLFPIPTGPQVADPFGNPRPYAPYYVASR